MNDGTSDSKAHNQNKKYKKKKKEDTKKKKEKEGRKKKRINTANKCKDYYPGRLLPPLPGPASRLREPQKKRRRGIQRARMRERRRHKGEGRAAEEKVDTREKLLYREIDHRSIEIDVWRDRSTR